MEISSQLMKGAQPYTIAKDVKRIFEVEDLKEIYTKEYLLEHHLCTPEEYARIPAGTGRAEDQKRAENWVILGHQVVGAEVDR